MIPLGPCPYSYPRRIPSVSACFHPTVPRPVPPGTHTPGDPLGSTDWGLPANPPQPQPVPSQRGQAQAGPKEPCLQPSLTLGLQAHPGGLGLYRRAGPAACLQGSSPPDLPPHPIPFCSSSPSCTRQSGSLASPPSSHTRLGGTGRRPHWANSPGNWSLVVPTCSVEAPV